MLTRHHPKEASLDAPIFKDAVFFSDSSKSAAIHPGKFRGQVGRMAGAVHGILHDIFKRLPAGRVIEATAKDVTAVNAVGWLIREHHVGQRYMKWAVTSGDENVSPEQAPLLSTNFDGIFVTPGAPQADKAAAATEAIHKALCYGFGRRDKSIRRNPDGTETKLALTDPRDQEIGARAGEVLRHVAKRVQSISLPDLVTRAWEKTDLGDGNPKTTPGGKKMFMVATALGWLSAQKDAVIHDGENIDAKLRLGRAEVHGDARAEIKKRAELMLEKLNGPESHELTTLMHVQGAQLINALSLGFLLQKNAVKLEDHAGAIIVKPTRKTPGE